MLSITTDLEDKAGRAIVFMLQKSTNLESKDEDYV